MYFSISDWFAMMMYGAGAVHANQADFLSLPWWVCTAGQCFFMYVVIIKENNND